MKIFTTLLFCCLLETGVFGQSTAELDPLVQSKVVRYFDFLSTGLSITERVQHNSSKSSLTIVGPSEPEFVSSVAPEAVPSGISHAISSQVANSDLIVMGTLENVRSFPTADQSFLFSEYSVRVESVLSNSKRIIPGDVIVIARPGGNAVMGGVKVAAVDPSFQPYQLGSKYIFFLQSIANTDVYRASAAGSFLVKNGQATESVLVPRTSNVQDLTSEIQSAIQWIGSKQK